MPSFLSKVLLAALATSQSILPLLLLPSFASAQKEFSCGVDNASADIMQAIQELSAESKFSRGPKQAQERKNPFDRNGGGGGSGGDDGVSPVQPRSLAIETYFHVVSGEGEDGEVTDQMLSQQLSVLNSAFAPHGISFNLADTTRTQNTAWSRGSDESSMTRKLRQGSYSALNLYFQTGLSGSIVGKCTLPARNVRPGSSQAYIDGCQITAGALPGGGLAGYDRGFTAVHEVGHWFGLLHVFEGFSCSGRGDYIDDTPLQRSPTQGCPARGEQDTCPSQPGTDAVNNYMDYSYDVCYEEFTPGQQERMYRMFDLFRAGK